MLDKSHRILLCFLATVALARGILVGPVRLKSQELYIDYRKGPSEGNSVIECPIKLSKGEEVSKVQWKLHQNDAVMGIYTYTVGSGGVAEDVLRNRVNTNREDWHLELTELRYDLAGMYSCRAWTTESESDAAAEVEVLIIDVIEPSSKGSVNSIGKCQFSSSFNMTAIYPEPTMHSGLYSDSLGGFVEEVAAIDWHKIRFENQSYAYSHMNVMFMITKKTPQDVYFVNSVGVLKKDGTYVPLFTEKVILREFEEKGCPAVKLGAYQKVEYNNDGKTTCRSEILPPGAGELRASIGCINGYKVADPTGIQTMELGCSKKSWKWGVSNDYPSLKHIQCVVDSAITPSGSSIAIIGCLLLLCLFQQ